MAIDWKSLVGWKQQQYMDLKKVLWPDNPRTIQALKDFDSQQRLNEFTSPKQAEIVVPTWAVWQFSNKINDLMTEWDVWFAQMVWQTKKDQTNMKEWIMRSQTWKWFLSLWWMSSWAWTPAWQTIAALDLVNNDTQTKLATVDANANNIISQARQQNTANRNALWQQQAINTLNFQTNKNQLDENKRQFDATMRSKNRNIDWTAATATAITWKKTTTKKSVVPVSQFQNQITKRIQQYWMNSAQSAPYNTKPFWK